MSRDSHSSSTMLSARRTKPRGADAHRHCPPATTSTSTTTTTRPPRHRLAGAANFVAKDFCTTRRSMLACCAAAARGARARTRWGGAALGAGASGARAVLTGLPVLALAGRGPGSAGAAVAAAAVQCAVPARGFLSWLKGENEDKKQAVMRTGADQEDRKQQTTTHQSDKKKKKKSKQKSAAELQMEGAERLRKIMPSNMGSRSKTSVTERTRELIFYHSSALSIRLSWVIATMNGAYWVNVFDLQQRHPEAIESSLLLTNDPAWVVGGSTVSALLIWLIWQLAKSHVSSLTLVRGDVNLMEIRTHNLLGSEGPVKTVAVGSGEIDTNSEKIVSCKFPDGKQKYVFHITDKAGNVTDRNILLAALSSKEATRLITERQALMGDSEGGAASSSNSKSNKRRRRGGRGGGRRR